MRGTKDDSLYGTRPLARLKVRHASRCPINNVLDMDGAALREVTDALNRLTASRAVIENYDRHPWRGCRIAGFSLTLQDEITHDFQCLSQTISNCAESVAACGTLASRRQNPASPNLKPLWIKQKGCYSFLSFRTMVCPQCAKSPHG